MSRDYFAGRSHGTNFGLAVATASSDARVVELEAKLSKLTEILAREFKYANEVYISLDEVYYKGVLDMIDTIRMELGVR